MSDAHRAAQNRREWWIYTVESWPEPTHGPYPNYAEARRVAVFVLGYDDYHIGSTDTANVQPSQEAQA